MDNTNQGLVSPFNLKAYGLANQLLQNQIPLMWAIKSGKAKDAVDFTAQAKRIVPSMVASTTVNFSSGPFIVPQAFAAQALPFINAFGNNVAVFELTANASVDVRYTLTHKPLIAVGLSNGMNDIIHKSIYDFALIPNYIDFDDATVNANSCVTIITQPHVETADGAPFVANYKTFAQSGGNLLLQCHAIEAYELPAGGRYQTTAGWVKDNVNDPDLLYPNPDMPFTQFIGDMNGSQGGSWRDYKLTTGALQNGAFISVTNADAANLGQHVATVSKVFNSGPGGIVFEMGGHSYGAGGSTLGDINGQRMLLNAVFQPPTRPSQCGFTLGSPIVQGYKQVRLTNDISPFNVVNPGDTLTWTLDYVNIGSVAVTNFQINDVLPTGSAITSPGAQTVTVMGAGTSAAANLAYTGAAAGAASNLLAAGAVLGANGRITVSIPTLVLPLAPEFLDNQGTATGTEIPVAGVKTDNIDSTTPSGALLGGVTALPDSIPQTQNPTVDPTRVIVVLSPTAAGVTVAGQVRTEDGWPVRGALVTLTDLGFGIGTQKTYVDFTGRFQFMDVEAGHYYMLEVSHRRYRFAQRFIYIGSDLDGIEFIAEPNANSPPVKGGGAPVGGGGKAVKP